MTKSWPTISQVITETHVEIVRSEAGGVTEREHQVLQLLAQGRSYAGIGRELYLSSLTVKAHAHRLYRKLGARGKAHAVARGYQTGLLSVHRPTVPVPVNTEENP